MTYERFSELWDALITNNPRLDGENIPYEINPETLRILAAYGQGDEAEMNEIKNYNPR